MNRTYILTGGGLGILIVIAMGWFFFPRQTPQEGTDVTGNSFATGGNVSVSDTSGSSGETNVPVASKGPIIFKIADGPVAGAVLIESGRPTTTVARYIMQESGHVLELPVDTPGAVPKAVSNMTIPGIVRVVWVERGSGLVAQYVDGTTVKTVYLGFPATSTAATSTSSPQASSAQKSTRIQFLPNNIADLAASPDGKNVAYLVRSDGGTDGYIARSDGSGGKKLFSFPLAQTLLSWPAQGTLLLQTKSGVGVPGGAFSINAQTGAIVPLVYAEGLTANTNLSFTQILYRTAHTDSMLGSSYIHDVKTGAEKTLPFDPFPEKCIWSTRIATAAVCATPSQFVSSNFLDLWHQGMASVPDSIFSFDLLSGRTKILAFPGGSDGGQPSSIAELTLSPSENYLGFVTRGDRTLWGVRLSTQ